MTSGAPLHQIAPKRCVAKYNILIHINSRSFLDTACTPAHCHAFTCRQVVQSKIFRKLLFIRPHSALLRSFSLRWQQRLPSAKEELHQDMKLISPHPCPAWPLWRRALRALCCAVSRKSNSCWALFRIITSQANSVNADPRIRRLIRKRLTTSLSVVSLSQFCSQSDDAGPTTSFVSVWGATHVHLFYSLRN